MKMNLLRGSFTYGAVTIISRVAAIFLIPVLTRLLTPEEYGVLSMILTIAILANVVVTIEIAQAVTYFFLNQKQDNRVLYPSTAFAFSLLMYLVFFIIVFISGNFWIDTYFSHESIRIQFLIYGSLLMAVNGTFFFLQNQFRLEFRTNEFAIFTIGYVLLTSVGAVLGAMYHSQKAEGVVLGQVIGAGIIDLLATAKLWQRLSKGINLIRLKEMLRFSFPLVIAAMLLLGGQQIPKFILSIYGTLDDVGIYGLAFQIAGFAGLAVLGVQTAITPSVLTNHHKEETPKKLARLFDIFAIVSLLFCAFLSVFAFELVMIFSVPSYSRAAEYVPFLAFTIAISSLYIFFPGKIIMGKSSSQLIASVGSFIVAIVTGLLFIKFDGVRGAAISALLAALTFFFIWCYLSQNLYRLPINWFKIFRMTILTTAVCWAGIYFFPSSFTFESIVIKSLMLILLTALISWKYLIEIRDYFLLKKKADL